MSLTRYADYRETKIAWLKLVPTHWGVGPLKLIIDRIDSGTSVNATDIPAAEGEIGVLKTSSVYKGYFTVNENKAVALEEISRVSCPLKKNTLIVSRMNTPDLVGAAGVVLDAPDNIYLPDRLWQVSFRLSQSVPAFVHYWTLTASYRDQIKMKCAGTSSSMQNIGQDDFRTLVLAFPGVQEQQRIAAFLDHETAKIDALVAEQQRLIELLKEKRQAAISHAVTKGLSPDVPMKDSGVDWLGEVPAHWEVLKVKQIAKLESGHTPSKEKPEYWEDGDVHWVSLNDSKALSKQDYISVTKYQITHLGIENSSARLLPPRAVVFTRDATIGLAAITEAEMAVSQHLIAWICSDRVVPEFLLLAFYAMAPELERYRFGATIKTIGMPDVRRLTLSLPGVEEQLSIVTSVFSERHKLDQLLAEAENSKKLLKERRSALISAAVTGKIDVRNWTPPASNPSDQSAHPKHQETPA